jgi:hypothetical protein
LHDRYGSGNLSARRALQVFEDIDANRDNRLSAREFKNGMANLKVEMLYSNLSVHISL